MAFAKYPVSDISGGDVTGPSSSVNNGVVLFNGTSGKVIKDLGVGSANQVLLTNGTTPSFGAITNAYIDPGAAIALSKLAALTASRALVSNGSGVISVSSVTDTELGYVSGVTSAIQTQLNTKANDSAVVHISGTETITGAKTFSSIIASSLTSNQFIAGNVTLSFTNSGTPTTITIPNVAPFATIPLLENAQTFTAQQSFSNNIVVQNRVIVFGTSQTITILGSTPASSRFVTIPEAGADSDFVLTAGSATIGGSKTFSSAVTINPASNQVILSTGVNQLTLNSGTSAAARTYTVPDTGTTDTFAMLGGAQTFTALKTFNSGLAIAGGAAANNTIWVASNILNIRGGTSGTDIYNTSGSVVVDITDAGAVTLGPANSSLVHITNGSGLSVRNNGASGGYVDGRQSGTAQWFVGKHSYNVFSGSSFGIGAVVAGLGVEFAAGNAIAGSISAAGAWTLGPNSGFSQNFSTGAHDIRGAVKFTLQNVGNSVSPTFVTASSVLQIGWNRTDGEQEVAFIKGNSAGTQAFSWLLATSASATTNLGSVSNAGDWTLGPSGNSATHSFRGNCILSGTTATSASNGFFVQNNSGTEMFKIRNDNVAFMRAINSVTTASAANVFIDSGTGLLQRSTSALKYKKNIVALEPVLKRVLAQRPVRYVSRSLVDAGREFIGFISDWEEERFPELVQKNQEGDVEGFAYAHMTAILTKAIQEQQVIIESLSTKNVEIEAKLAALKAS